MYDLRLFGSASGQELRRGVAGRRQGSVRDDRKHWAVRIDERHFLDLGQRGESFHDAEIDSLLGESSTQQGAEEQSQNAVEGMDANLLIGPVMQWSPTDKVGIFHSFEGLLNMVLTPIRAHDVFVAPPFLVGEEEIFAQQRPLQTLPGALPHLIVQTRLRRPFGRP